MTARTGRRGSRGVDGDITALERRCSCPMLHCRTAEIPSALSKFRAAAPLSPGEHGFAEAISRL